MYRKKTCSAGDRLVRDTEEGLSWDIVDAKWCYNADRSATNPEVHYYLYHYDLAYILNLKEYLYEE